ncbi:superoxide dismutase family protein [Robiginitomaculum antarcticum]|uniref:superoxide dismutase family protein n=1 Tax=Robiginitomaculum antarcticum TaxID=437507 RepID=UPI0003702F60|nr:superoxide dismutase family protein [Robiginitomaculum antarcticum]
MTKITALALSLLTATAMTACGDKTPDNQIIAPKADTPTATSTQTQPVAPDPAKMMSRSFPLMNASGNQIGNVIIKDVANGVDFTVKSSSLIEGTSAIHFHETGSCEGPAFTSAGGHYNPTGVMHGKDTSTGPHAGDMENIDVPVSGMVDVTRTNTKVSLVGRDGLPALLDTNGSAFIIHAGADDYKSQPSGAAGSRIACAVIAD